MPVVVFTGFMEEYEFLEIQAKKGSRTLAEVYAKAWEERYKCRPYLLDTDFDLLYNLILQVGMEKATEAVKHYLTMTVPYFVSRGHDLQTLKRGFNQVMASCQTHKVNPRGMPAIGEGLKIRTMVLCDACPPAMRQHHMEVVGTVEEIQNLPHVCPTCAEEGLSPMDTDTLIDAFERSPGTGPLKGSLIAIIKNARAKQLGLKLLVKPGVDLSQVVKSASQAVVKETKPEEVKPELKLELSKTNQPPREDLVKKTYTADEMKAFVREQMRKTEIPF